MRLAFASGAYNRGWGCACAHGRAMFYASALYGLTGFGRDVGIGRASARRPEGLYDKNDSLQCTLLNSHVGLPSSLFLHMDLSSASHIIMHRHSHLIQFRIHSALSSPPVRLLLVASPLSNRMHPVSSIPSLPIPSPTQLPSHIHVHIPVLVLPSTQRIPRSRSRPLHVHSTVSPHQHAIIALTLFQHQHQHLHATSPHVCPCLF